MPEFTIYKASAGSGKTHTLVGEYLKMVLNPDRPSAYRNVLAVTFTNKATAEMKERIIKALSQLANGEPSDYASELCDSYKLSNAQLQSNAAQLLKQILNRYSRFKVNTIDSFFQLIIKSIAYELDLDNNFTLELDRDSVIDAAVSRMLDDYGRNRDSNNRIDKWLIDSISDNIDKGSRWDIKNSIVKFVSKAEREDDNDNSQPFDIEAFKVYKKQLRQILKTFWNNVNLLGQKFVDTMDAMNLTVSDFVYGQKGIATIRRWNNIDNFDDLKISGHILNALSSGKWCKDQQANNQIIGTQMPQMLQHVIDSYKMAISAQAVLDNVNSYVLARLAKDYISQFCEEQNIFLLQSTMPFLNRMIDGSDAPFIYERMGARITSFMIDEFQDTSNLNWENFLPLVQNGLSQGRPSLIVGDVKQAIYRWRGGDWDLLGHKVADEVPCNRTINLPTNYRSLRNIVEFNNWCFEAIKQCISSNMLQTSFSDEQIKRFACAYADVSQSVPEQENVGGGFVSVEVFDKNDPDHTRALWLVEQIDRLAELGYQPSDIAVLTRRNEDASNVANALAEAQAAHPELAERYQFVSSESVLLGNNQAIRLIVSAMQFLLTPNDRHTKAQLVWMFFVKKSGTIEAARHIQQIHTDKDFSDNGDEVAAMLGSNDFNLLRTTFRQLDIIQLTGQLVRIFGALITETDLPFINEFEDNVLNFNNRYGSSLQAFIEWWNEYGQTKNITMNDRQNAIRILTIHKAKGLEFNAVILPYLQNEIKSGDIIWCKTDVEPFCQFSPMPITYKNNLKDSVFASDYNEERFMKCMDNINLIYVALTRAKADMRIYLENSSTRNIKDILLQVLESANDNSNINIDKERMRYTIGKECKYTTGNNNDNSLFRPANLSGTSGTPATVLIRQHSEGYFDGIDLNREKRINTGTVYHYIFEHIRTNDDIAAAVQTAANNGIIDRSEIDSYKADIKLFISKQKAWFADGHAVLTEQSLMLANGEIRRPDRIIETDNLITIIDYKFPQSADTPAVPDAQRAKYCRQVAEYMRAVAQLTHKKVEGYVWYVPTNQVDTVKI